MVLKRFTTLIKRPAQEEVHAPDADTPEANAARGVRLFCESGAANSGEEVLHLPTIVESAVASPGAAAAACSQIRKFLSKENYSRPHVQYNAVMLIRILADNPGPSFTKNMDKHFADTVKHLLRSGQDPSVAQILRETLDALDKEKAYDTNLNALFAMWRKEKGLMANAAKQFGPRTMNAPPWSNTRSGQHSGSGASSRTLPAPSELVSRVEEARTSAKLLLQLVQSTPPNELLGNDLVKEFSERCMSAQRSMQGYINCDNPPPDDDTMLTLIETNEQLSLAASKHQRAVLQARRLLGGATPSPPITTATNNNTFAPANSFNPPAPTTAYQPPPQPPRIEVPLQPPLDVRSNDTPSSANLKHDLPLPPALQAGTRSPREPDDNPFADHHSPTSTYSAPNGPPPAAPRRVEDEPQNSGALGGRGSPQSYNPGFQSTPSYLGRQESSSNNLTMHGGRELTEEEEYARDYPISGGPTTPEQPRRTRDIDVSPVAERGAVTYRY